MLERFLDEHPLISLMKGTPGCPFPSASDREAWQSLSVEKKRDILELADAYREIPYPMLPATAFMSFVRTGNRKEWEDPYFLRRRKLCAAFLHCCVTGEDRDLDAVIDGLWCICEETSWVISAHNGSAHEGTRPAAEHPLPDPKNPYVDLFAGQTAMILSLICAMLGEKLDRTAPIIRRRVAAQIESRILTPFETRDDFWWMGFIRRDLCNWTPWIVSNVMLTASLWIGDKLRLAELLTRGCRMLDRWIRILPEDGGCDEGAGYWNMAGGALLDCLELLSRLTDGAIDLWDDLKLRGIVSFPAKVCLEHGWFVNFADCDARPWISGERLQYAGERMGAEALAALGMSLRQKASLQLSDTPQLWRLLNELFHPAMEHPETVYTEPRNVWLPHLQVRVLERDGLLLACKGGHNGESHNHNDVGSFILYVDGRPAVVDAGNMTYTAKTFSDRRYELWNTRSAYHNLPMIGGHEQMPGTDRCASRVEALDCGLSLDVSRAYDLAGLDYHRALRLERGALLVHDSISIPEPLPVTWVFMLRDMPAVDGQTVTAGPVRITMPEGLTAAVEEIPVTDARMARNYPGSLWRLTCAAEPGTVHEAEFTFARS